MMRLVCVALFVIGLVFLEACGGSGSSQDSDTSADFIIQVGDEQFIARVTSSQQIQTARQLLSGQLTGKIINGLVLKGSGGFNINPKTGVGWDWHLEPTSIEFSDITVELCDGLPSYVEGHLDEWLEVVKRYCPWNGEVVGELE